MVGGVNGDGLLEMFCRFRPVFSVPCILAFLKLLLRFVRHAQPTGGDRTQVGGDPACWDSRRIGSNNNIDILAELHGFNVQSFFIFLDPRTVNSKSLSGLLVTTWQDFRLELNHSTIVSMSFLLNRTESIQNLDGKVGASWILVSVDVNADNHLHGDGTWLLLFNSGGP